jgi:hypothetical protein
MLEVALFPRNFSIFLTFVFHLCWIPIQIHPGTEVHYGSGSDSAKAKSCDSSGSGFTILHVEYRYLVAHVYLAILGANVFHL